MSGPARARRGAGLPQSSPGPGESSAAPSGSELFQAVEQAAEIIMITDRRGRIEYVNSTFEAQTGYARQEVQGKTARILKSGCHTDRFYTAMWRTLNNGEVFRAEFINRRKDGSLYVEEKIITPIKAGGRITHFFSAGRDVTEQKQHEEELSRFRLIQDITSDLVAVIDSDKGLIYINNAGRRMLGLPPGELQGKDTAQDRLGLLLSDDAVASLTLHRRWSGDTVIVRANGRRLPVSVVLLAQTTGGGLLDFIAVIARDISSQKQMEKDLRRAADYDSLTGIFNRRRLEAEIRGSLERPGRGKGALLILGLDDFKSVNDCLGHNSGDQVLRDVAARLNRAKRGRDVVSRLEGDKFAILLRGVNEREASSEAQRMLQTVREAESLIDNERVRITASVGVALLPADGKSPDELITNADAALYEAKDRRRNSYCIYNPASKRRVLSRTRFDWRNNVVGALEEDRLQLYGQPLLDLHSRRIEKFEVLLRAPGIEGDLMLPRDFLVNAELSGLAQEVDRWVAQRAIALLGEIGPGRVQLAVNLSPTSIGTREFQDFLSHQLAVTGANPADLILEITEAAAIKDMRAATLFVSGLQEIGCHFALDDFGTGFSSLAVLRDLPVDYIKIDGSFVANLMSHSKNEHIIRAIVDLAHAFGRQTVAEFVDSASTARRLKKLGVDYAQGFYIGKPAPIRELVFDGLHESSAAA